MAISLNAPQKIYDNLWSEGISALEQGNPEIDPFLSNKKSDPRRCVTLALRPTSEVQAKVTAFLRQAAKAAPDQYYYRPDELHVTVLAVIPSTPSWREHMHELPVIENVLAELLHNRGAFSIAFRGITVSRNAVMVQGFPADDSLTRLREELRSVLKRNNVCANIDRRYRISGAHITAMRFASPGTNWNQLLELLKTSRDLDFGETRVRTLELLLGDFYASADVVQKLELYPLV
jgi:2'-5' RNA ligase